MKLASVLLLCGLSCALASPPCDDHEAEKCATGEGRDPGKFYPESEADLNDFCKIALDELDCQIDYTERCPHTLLGAFREGLKKYRTIFGKLCEKDTPLREKFLEKGACLNKEVESAEEACSESVTEKDYCKKVVTVLNCAEEAVNRACGSDGKEVYAELFRPKYSLQSVFCELS